MLDQYSRMLLHIAEARRMHGTQDRFGTVHEVWRKDGEQKIRVNIGIRPNGEPWLTPWLKVSDHHGALREQQKFHKGQNVKVSAVGADFHQATVSPHGENKAHPEPAHADDHHETAQYAKFRRRIGPDFAEHWLAKGDSGSNPSNLLGGVLGDDFVGGGGTGGGGGSTGRWTDPDEDGVVVTRMGAKPQRQQDKEKPWEGPSPEGGDPEKRHMTWTGEAGNTPEMKGDAIVTQFDKDAKLEFILGTILSKVQSTDGPKMTSPDAGEGTAKQTTTDQIKDGVATRKVRNNQHQKTTTTVHKNGDITHVIEDALGNISRITQQMNQIIHQMQTPDGAFSFILHQAGQIFHQVTDASGATSILQITAKAINLNSASVNVNTEGFSTSSSPPAAPSTSSSGDAPLMQIAQQWSIEAHLTVAAHMTANAVKVP